MLITQQWSAFHSSAHHQTSGAAALSLSSSHIMGLYIHIPSGIIESFIHWWDLFSKANLWQWNLSCLKVRPWDHCPHKNGFMVHISAKGTRKVNQGREISRGYAFLQTISAYPWSSNFPESIACQNQFKSSLKHSCWPLGIRALLPIWSQANSASPWDQTKRKESMTESMPLPACDTMGRHMPTTAQHKLFLMSSGYYWKVWSFYLH